jgi:hypothetical protein
MILIRPVDYPSEKAKQQKLGASLKANLGKSPGETTNHDVNLPRYRNVTDLEGQAAYIISRAARHKLPSVTQAFAHQ